MAKRIIGKLVVSLMVFLILTSCSVEKEEETISPIVESEEELFEVIKNEDYHTAYYMLLEPYEAEKLNKSGQDLFEEIKEKYYNQYNALANKEFEEKNFVEARKYFEEVLKLDPENTEVEDMIRVTNELVKQQDEFNSYLVTFKKIVDDSNKLLTSFNQHLDKVQTGEMKPEQFVEWVKQIIPQSNKIITELDTYLYELDGSLLDIHKNVISVVNFQHQMFLNSLQLSEDNLKVQDRLRSDFITIKHDQTSMIQDIKKFAIDRSLSMTVDINQ